MDWVPFKKIEKSITNRLHKKNKDKYGVYEAPLEEMEEFLSIDDCDELIRQGYNFLEGRDGFDKNIRKAISLFERAESFASVHSAMILCVIYSKGNREIKADGSKSHYYYKLAEKHMKSTRSEAKSAKEILEKGDNNLIQPDDKRLSGLEKLAKELNRGD